MAERARTITWEDPTTAADDGRELSGLDYFAAMDRGDLALPPIMALIGFEAVEFDEGRVVFAAQPGEYHYNAIGVVHAGLALTVLDSAMSSAVHTTLAAGVGFTTLEVKMNFVRPLRVEDGRVLACGTALHRGSRTATAEGRLERASDGRLVAHGTATCLILGSV